MNQNNDPAASGLRWFEVRYQLAYQHVVAVGIEARNEDEAIAKAQAAFDAGTIWDDTAAIPLVYDEYEETDDNTLEFSATPLTARPKPEQCVLELQQSSRMAGLVRQLAALNFDSLDLIHAHQRLAALVDEARAILAHQPEPIIPKPDLFMGVDISGFACEEDDHG